MVVMDGFKSRNKALSMTMGVFIFCKFMNIVVMVTFHMIVEYVAHVW